MMSFIDVMHVIYMKFKSSVMNIDARGGGFITFIHIIIVHYINTNELCNPFNENWILFIDLIDFYIEFILLQIISLFLMLKKMS